MIKIEKVISHNLDIKLEVGFIYFLRQNLLIMLTNIHAAGNIVVKN